MQVTSSFWVVTQPLPTAERTTIPNLKEERHGFHMSPIAEIFIGEKALKSRDWIFVGHWGKRNRKYAKVWIWSDPFLRSISWVRIGGLCRRTLQRAHVTLDDADDDVDSVVATHLRQKTFLHSEHVFWEWHKKSANEVFGEINWQNITWFPHPLPQNNIVHAILEYLMQQKTREEGSICRFGRTWIKTIFLLCIPLWELLFGIFFFIFRYKYITKILFVVL